ncbi:iron ABC transporter permease [Ancylobacter sp. MQZ15Z-1]|uniref:Iron ABC transporter permease n=1 Tax=Ancylobacter mangrovi TaxID=2972472 RepID=A0A9X2PD99_9HYPH|nr:iron ABC transporter permease [Ancylobacter mangrovi]MCS0496556.1 iron ABC transporter permease [Ancylobacter mangrovi]
MSTADLAAVSPPARVGPLTLGAAYWLFIAAVAVVTLFPVVVLFVTAFEVGTFGRETVFGFDNWIEPFRSPRLLEALWNTLTLSAARQIIALVVSIGLAWLIARSNLPGRGWLEVGFWIAMFMPALPVTMAWILLAGGRSGLINIWLRDLSSFLPYPLFNIYSWGGIIWVHLVTSTIPIKVFLLIPAFRNLDASLEESARACGSGLIETIRRIVVPLMVPILVVTTLIGLIGAMQSFEIELILGTPASIDVYSTIIYSAMKQEPPLYGVASVLSILFVTAILPFVFLQKWYGGRHTYGTLGGRFSSRTQDLGRWRWPLFALVLLLVMLMTVVPTAMIITGTFMKLFGAFNLPQPWTLDHWHEAFSQSELYRSLTNTLKLGFGAAFTGMIVYSAIAYITARKRYMGGGLLDFLTWMPTVIPGIVMSMGLLQMFLQVPVLRPIYGTTWALILAVLIGGMTVGAQIIRGTLLQLSSELEEASWTSGASRWRTFRKVLLPLVAPSVIVAGLNIFGTGVSVVSLVVLLGTGPSQPLSILQLAYLDSGHFEPATIIGLFILAIAVTAAVLARIVSARFVLSR